MHDVVSRNSVATSIRHDGSVTGCIKGRMFAPHETQITLAASFASRRAAARPRARGDGLSRSGAGGGDGNDAVFMVCRP